MIPEGQHVLIKFGEGVGGTVRLYHLHFFGKTEGILIIL